MADDKKTEAPAKKKSPLYDHKKAEPKKAEPKKADGETKTEKTTVQSDLKSGEKNPKSNADPKGGDGKDEKKDHPVKTTHDRHHEARSGMHKQHENERRDFHGNQRDAHRQMTGRHEKAIKDLVEQHMTELMAGAAGGGDPALAGAAPGGASPGPAAPAGIPGAMPDAGSAAAAAKKV